MIFDYCPNCSGPLTFFNFSCGSEIEQQYLCQSCRFCSYTFQDHDVIFNKIVGLISRNQKFYVTCNNDFIYNWSPDTKNENTTILKQADPIEKIQEDLNKKYTLKLDNIMGFNGIKRLMQQVINVKNKKKVHLAIMGHPGTAKTVFLLSAKDELEPQGLICNYLDCSNLTGSGLLDHILTLYVDEQKKIDILFLDEIDKTDLDDQKKFLNVLQTGIAKNTKRYDKRSAQVSITAIATANDIHRIYRPLLDRFTSVYIPQYTKDQFFQIGDFVLNKKYQLSEYVRQTMLLKIWQIDGSLRRVDDLGILIKSENNDQLKISKFEDVINTLNTWKVPKQQVK